MCSAVLVVLLIACTQQKSKQFDTSYVNLIIDIHTAEAAIQQAPRFKRDSVAKLYYTQIAEMHKMTRTELKEKMDTLYQNPKQMERIYKKALQKIEDNTERHE